MIYANITQNVMTPSVTPIMNIILTRYISSKISLDMVEGDTEVDINKKSLFTPHRSFIINFIFPQRAYAHHLISIPKS